MYLESYNNFNTITFLVLFKLANFTALNKLWQKDKLQLSWLPCTPQSLLFNMVPLKIHELKISLKYGRRKNSKITNLAATGNGCDIIRSAE